MNKPNIELTYHANYNGWDMYINGKHKHPYEHLTDQMADITADFCDDDGNYLYNCLQTNHAISVRNIVEEALGECSIDIEFDTCST